MSFNWGIDPELFWFYGAGAAGQDGGGARRRRSRPRSRSSATSAPDERELRKAKNILQADYVRGLSSVSGKANQLGFYETVFGDYREMFKEVDRVEAVTAADVQRVARTYLVDRARTTVELVPEQPKAGSAAAATGARASPAAAGVTR